MFTRYLAIGVVVLAGLFTAYAVFYAFTTPAQQMRAAGAASAAGVARSAVTRRPRTAPRKRPAACSRQGRIGLMSAPPCN